MRTLAFTLLLGLIAFTTGAQRKAPSASSQMERGLYELTTAINDAYNSRMTPVQKDAQVRKAIRNYMMVPKADEIMSNTSCDQLTIKAYLHDLQMQNFDEVPSSYIKKMGNVKTDCALSQAIELYEMVGHNLESSDQLCSVMGCDDLVDKRTVKNRNSRSTQRRDNRNDVQPMASDKTKWRYTGVKRYFVEKEKFGWRYLCIDNSTRVNTKLSKEQIENAIAELEKNIEEAEEAGTDRSGTIEIPAAIKGVKLAWKLNNQVDIW